MDLKWLSAALGVDVIGEGCVSPVASTCAWRHRGDTAYRPSAGLPAARRCAFLALHHAYLEDGDVVCDGDPCAGDPIIENNF